jgi:hypothetical protein
VDIRATDSRIIAKSATRADSFFSSLNPYILARSRSGSCAWPAAGSAAAELMASDSGAGFPFACLFCMSSPFSNPLAFVLKRVHNDSSLKALHVVKEKTKRACKLMS